MTWFEALALRDGTSPGERQLACLLVALITLEVTPAAARLEALANAHERAARQRFLRAHPRLVRIVAAAGLECESLAALRTLTEAEPFRPVRLLRRTLPARPPGPPRSWSSSR